MKNIFRKIDVSLTITFRKDTLIVKFSNFSLIKINYKATQSENVSFYGLTSMWFQRN